MLTDALNCRQTSAVPLLVCQSKCDDDDERVDDDDDDDNDEGLDDDDDDDNDDGMRRKMKKNCYVYGRSSFNVLPFGCLIVFNSIICLFARPEVSTPRPTRLSPNWFYPSLKTGTNMGIN